MTHTDTHVDHIVGWRDDCSVGHGSQGDDERGGEMHLYFFGNEEVML